MSYTLSDLMQLLISERGEAIHLHDGEAPVLEVHRKLFRIEGPPLAPGDTQTLLRSIAPAAEFKEALRDNTVYEHHHGGGAYFQVMAFKEGGSIRLELRRVF